MKLKKPYKSNKEIKILHQSTLDTLLLFKSEFYTIYIKQLALPCIIYHHHEPYYGRPSSLVNLAMRKIIKASVFVPHIIYTRRAITDCKTTIPYKSIIAVIAGEGPTLVGRLILSRYVFNLIIWIKYCYDL